MIVPDTSAWVEYLRATGSAAHLALRELLDREEIAVTEVILMELLAGARDRPQAEALRRELLRFPLLPLRPLEDYELAAEIYRLCRAEGETLRHTIDCLIAVPALRRGASVLTTDADFEVIARHTELRLVPVDRPGAPLDESPGSRR